MNITYRRTSYELNKGSFTTDDGHNYISYGINAFKIEKGIKIILDRMDDISPDFNFVNDLASKFNRFDLHIEHFRDVISDEIGA